MTKRKILWFSGVHFTEEKIKTTGTWLIAMGNAIAKTEDIELYNVAYGDVKSISQKNSGNITQWIVPHKERTKYHRSSNKLISFIKRLDSEINPDLIHIWGTESGLGFAVSDAKLETPILVDIQGLLFSIVKNYYGGLSYSDLWRSVGLKEVLRPMNNLYFKRKIFKDRGKYERRLIKRLKNISVQSDWIHTIIKYINPECNLFHTRIMLRSEFHEAIQWKRPTNNETINIFTSSSGSIPYKGLHVIFEAIAVLKNKFPNIKLNIGGGIDIHKKYGFIREGYTSWMLDKIQGLGIEDCVVWLGHLNASEMIAEMHKSSLVVIPSFVESYCLFLAESMMVGVPSVVSFAGAMAQLAEHEKTALYFPMGDHWSCARQIERLITDPVLANKLSEESRKVALQRNDPDTVLQTQLDIYNEILNAKSN